MFVSHENGLDTHPKSNYVGSFMSPTSLVVSINYNKRRDSKGTF